ncbi:MAG: hypothetical protein JHC93_08185 [Parachlamydiales bacterium]|nr:hypothetical protein [Parachlamydiales bacterium]
MSILTGSINGVVARTTDQTKHSTSSEYLSSWRTAAKLNTLKLASKLTDPICKVREYYYTFNILDYVCKSPVQKVVKSALLILGIGGCGLIAPFTAPLGAALRGIVATCESKPFTFIQNSKVGKVLPEDKKITVFSHNQCYPSGGYAITNGGVLPPSYRSRIDDNLKVIKEMNPDIVCLYEVSDICDACYISSQLKDYPYIIPIAGTRALGPTSQLYIASKYEIIKDSIEFTPFIKGSEITGRGAKSEKGFLSFDIKSYGDNHACANIISTHLQHSEVPSKPEATDVTSRAAQMKKIGQKIQDKIDKGYNVILTGDLNQEEIEIDNFLSHYEKDWLRRDPNVVGISTWGGDKWGEKLTDYASSKDQVLDFTFIAGKTLDISTTILDNGFSGLEFRPSALSDHNAIFSTIHLN